jgi:putative transposase
VDGRGVPLSIVVTAANVNDGKRIAQVLESIVVKRKSPPVRRHKHLCADAGYRSAEAIRIMESHGYIPNVANGKHGARTRARNPWKKPRRWIVEVCHSWFNRFRKLQTRHEKLDRSFMALNHLAAAVIAFRKVPGELNIIYG